ncbi:MAG: plasmid pRiA4b ORF-3 family protein [Erysipelotrichaceae bacterium]|nr:plasmid pRiA4b ORF-3 family protein [Erysipelotrichaceae bacterium]
MNSNHGYVLRIELVGSEPLVWRRFQIPNDASFHELHKCMQVLFGWKNIHNYIFKRLRDQQAFVDVEDAGQGTDTSLNARVYMLEDSMRVGEIWEYIYDMGDWWTHRITVEREAQYSEEQEKTCPLLLDWEQEPLAEDTGGCEGYYEKQRILADPKHPDHDFIKAWLAQQQEPFEEESIRDRLVEISDETEEETPFEWCARLLESWVEFCESPTVVSVQKPNKAYELLIYNEASYRAVEVYRKKQDLVNRFLCSSDPLRNVELYREAIVFQFPVDEEEEDMNMEMFISYSSAGEGERMIEKEEFLGLGDLFDILAAVLDTMQMHIDEGKDVYVPSLADDRALFIRIEGNRLKIGDFPYELNLPKSRLKLPKAAVERIKQKRVSTERLTINLLAIPDLIRSKENHIFYIAAAGKRTGFLHKLNSKDQQLVMKEIRDCFCSYMETYGVPQRIDVEDPHLYELLRSLCAPFSVDLRLHPCKEELIAEQFEEALLLENPMEEMDPELLQLVSDYDEDAFYEFIERQTEEDAHKLVRQLLFMKMIKKR